MDPGVPEKNIITKTMEVQYSALGISDKWHAPLSSWYISIE